jgi:hypothetical protein
MLLPFGVNIDTFQVVENASITLKEVLLNSNVDFIDRKRIILHRNCLQRVSMQLIQHFE